MARRTPPRKARYFEPVAPHLARNTVIESTFEVGRRYRCTMRVDCSRLHPGVVIRPEPCSARSLTVGTAGCLSRVSRARRTA